MLNRATLIGHVGAAPEIKSMNSGNKVANFTLATSEKWRDKQSGERKEATEWHRIVTFNEHLIPVIEQYVHKGSRLYIEGTIKTRKWTDQSGVDKYTTEIVLSNFNGVLKLLGDKGERAAPSEGDYGAAKAGSPAAGRTTAADLDDDLPF